MRYHFSKYHGAGNDLIIIDDRPAQFPESRELIQKICHRNYGIGSDGLILLREDSFADYRMVFFNPDGNQVAMCGNGIRCLVHFLHKLGIEKSIYHIATVKKVYPCRRLGEKVVVNMGTPQILQWDYTISDGQRFWKCYVVDSGVPHVIIFTSDLAKEDVGGQGKIIRNLACFSPEGVNVSFIHVTSSDCMHIRTYERGVEAETLACGTAATAASFVARKLGLLSSKVEVFPLSREKIEINFHSGDKEEEVEMIGQATCVYQAVVDME
jgi:diaminopimelate epimerase